MRHYFNYFIVSVLIILFSGKALLAQNLEVVSAADSTTKKFSIMQFQDTTYQNSATGELTPGKGFNLVKTDFASLNLSIYAMVRYLNQMPGEQTWHDHLGREREFVGRNDFNWHRTMLWFTGFVGTPKFTYLATVWTVMTTQQTLVYGNLNYRFNKHVSVGMGIAPNLGIRSLQGPFPYFSSTDRTMTEDGIRPGFTNGLFVKGEIVPRLNYTLMLGNNLSTLGVQAAKLTRDLSQSVSIVWLPTTGEFGPRGGLGDLEHHNKLATRFGASYTHSREDRFNNTGQPSPDNTQVRMSDGVLFFETGALADGVTVDKADYDLLAVDLGFKYKGFCLYTEAYYRTLSDFDADGPLPISKITDLGYTFQISYMVIPKILCVYGINSMMIDEFERNPYDLGGGVNIYPLKTRNWRINAQAAHVEKSSAGGTFGLYTAGQTGTTVTFGVDIIL